MAKNSDTGITQLKNGNWQYRITLAKDATGKPVDTTGRVDANGNPFATKRAAKQAREQKLVELRDPQRSTKPKDATLQEVWDRYLKNGTTGKATATLVKQTTMWKNHISPRFGKKLISEIDQADLYDYLTQLYNFGDEAYNKKAKRKHDGGYSYAYVEGFLKFFYLLFGRAYEYELIDHKRYTRMFIDKGTRLKMPAKRQADVEDEEDGADIFSDLQIRQLDTLFSTGNLYTAFLLGYYLGVRISECFALRWQNINWAESTITINRQMGYDKDQKLFYLGPVKTLTSVRVIDIPKTLQNYLYNIYHQQKEQEQKYGIGYRNNERVAVRMKPKQNDLLDIADRDFINRKENGELLTTNSVKYWAKAINATLGFEFRYHSLRKTHATKMAELNTPAIELMRRLGHKKYETTLAYYINVSKSAREATLHNLSQITIKDKKTMLPNKEVNTEFFLQLVEDYEKLDADTPCLAE